MMLKNERLEDEEKMTPLKVIRVLFLKNPSHGTSVYIIILLFANETVSPQSNGKKQNY